MGIFDKLSRGFAERTIRTSIKMYRRDNPGISFMTAMQTVL